MAKKKLSEKETNELFERMTRTIANTERENDYMRDQQRLGNYGPYDR